jgi:hypothetical protein
MSIAERVPPISAETYARRESGEKATARGRMSTSTLPTTFPVRASRIETLLLVSAVTQTQRPSGLAATPSGSIPTTEVVSRRREWRSIIVAVPTSSFAAKSRRPSGDTASCSGSLPARCRPVTRRVLASMTTIASWLDSSFGDGSLTATYTVRPSGDRWMPRGRPSSGIVATTVRSERSTIDTSFDPSLLT